MRSSTQASRGLMVGTACAVLALASVPTTALAQDAADESDGGIAEIVVTAQKRSENVQSVPIAISVATGEDIARLQVSNVA